MSMANEAKTSPKQSKGLPGVAATRHSRGAAEQEA